MTISFELPQNIEQQVRTNGADLNREAKVAYLIDLYRRERITRDDLSEALDLGFHETERLLKEHGVGDDFTSRSSRQSMHCSARSAREDCRLRHDPATLPDLDRLRSHLAPTLRASLHSPAVIHEMNDPSTPEAATMGDSAARVASRAGAGPHRGYSEARPWKAGSWEKAAIALARELHAEIVLMELEGDPGSSEAWPSPGSHADRLGCRRRAGLCRGPPRVLDHLEQTDPILREQGMQTRYRGHEAERP